MSTSKRLPLSVGDSAGTASEKGTGSGPEQDFFFKAAKQLLGAATAISSVNMGGLEFIRSIGRCIVHGPETIIRLK